MKSVLLFGLIFIFSLHQMTVKAEQSNAQNQNQESKKDVDTVVITSTRTEKPLSEVVGTVSVIDAAQIEKQLANTISDLVRYEPGVNVTGGGRFGFNGFTIRGIDGDRVLTLLDNTPIADEFSFGPFLSSRRDFVDIDAVKSVEIVRGAASSSFGSNAIGGVVNFITKEPAESLAGKNFALGGKVGYSSLNEGTHYNVKAEFGNPTLAGLLVLSYRDYEETETFFGKNDSVTGNARQTNNPQEGENTNFLFKTVYNVSEKHKLSLSYDYFDSESATNVLTSVGVSSRGVLTTGRTGDDERKRHRVSLAYDFSTQSALLDSGKILVYTQESESNQITASTLLARGAIRDRLRTSHFEQENNGAKIQFAKSFTLGNSQHNFLYGLDYDVSDSITLREGSTIDRRSGRQLREFSNFSTRDFPNSEYKTLGVFLQDEMQFLQGRLEVIPSIRYDSFELNPTVDVIYLSGNTGSPTPADYDESEVSFKLGSIFYINDDWSVFAQYAEGFRAPPLDAINTGFTNFAGGYTTLPNPNLRPETSDGFEVGFRYNTERAKFSASYYKNDYKDFIIPLVSRGFNRVTGLLEFQAINAPEAEIKGFEFKGSYKFTDALIAHASFAYADGENTATSVPISSVDPEQLVLGLEYNTEQWGVEGIVTFTAQKNASDIDASSLRNPRNPSQAVNVFEPDNYQLFDVLAYYNINDKFSINLGVFNITDEEYHPWSEALIQDPARVNFDRFTAPGRNVSLNIKLAL